MTSSDSASAGTGERVAGLAQRLRGLDQRIAQLARHAGGGPLEQPRTDQQVVGQLGLALAGVEFGGDRVRQVAIGSPQPSTRNVHSPTLSGEN